MSEEWSTMTVVKLREELKKRGLSYVGLKSQLIERLESSVASEVSDAESLNTDAAPSGRASRGRKAGSRQQAPAAPKAASRLSRRATSYLADDEASQLSEAASEAGADVEVPVASKSGSDPKNVEADIVEEPAGAPETKVTKTPSKSNVEDKSKTPAKTPSKSSAEMSTKTPAKTPTKTPAKTPSKHQIPESVTEEEILEEEVVQKPKSPEKSAPVSEPAREVVYVTPRNPIVIIFSFLWPILAMIAALIAIVVLFPSPNRKGALTLDDLSDSIDIAGVQVTDMIASILHLKSTNATAQRA